MPYEGNVVVGDFESFGIKDVWDVTSDRQMRAWVEDYWLSQEDAIRLYVDKCM